MKHIHDYPINIIHDLPPENSAGVCAIDIEIFGMHEPLHRPITRKRELKKVGRTTKWVKTEPAEWVENGKFASMQMCLDGETVYYITDTKDIEEALHRVKDATWVLHNAKFDITHLRRWSYVPKRKKLWDTMLVEQVRFSGYYRLFSLQNLVRRYLGVYMPKDVRETYEEGQELTQDQIEYGAYDAVLTWHVSQQQKKEIDASDLAVYKKIEVPFLWTILSMSGLRMNVDAWIQLAQKNKILADEIAEKYSEINLGSPKQVKDRLHKDGYKVDSTGEKVIEGLKDKSDFARDVLLYRKYAKKASTYGDGFIDDYVEGDGKIYVDIYQIGTVTARPTGRNPNTLNIPSAKEYRDCFIADEGGVMEIADWSSQEPRVAAFLSSDSLLMSYFNTGKDIYTLVAKDVMDDDFAELEKTDYKAWKARRKPYKSLILGVFYGMSAFGLGNSLGISQDAAQEMIDNFFKTFPGVANYVKTQQEKTDYVTSIYGRKIWVNEYSFDVKRVVLNYPIQSSSADALKIAAYQFVFQWDKDFYQNTPLKLMVYDEMGIGVEKEESANAEIILNRVMVEAAQAMHKGIRAEAEVSIGNSWAVKA